MFQKICNILSSIIIVILLVIAAILLIPPLLGYESMAVLSGSMEPEIAVGEIVFAKEVEVSELEVGDIVTYSMGGTTRVTHRIVEIHKENQEIITKGDANENVDGSPVPYSNIIGQVMFHVPFLGFISIYLRTPLGIAALCGVLFVMILLIFLPEIIGRKKE